jgi:hypothetical protein
MKRLVLMMLVAGSLVACKKNGVTLSANITGKWELHRRYGGFIIPPDTTYQAGNGNILQFNSDGTYKRYANGSVASQGTYRVVPNGYRSGSNVYDELIFDNDTSGSIVSINGSILTISSLIPDVGSSDYEKIAN